ncbi:MAG: HD domain-containing protein, partial [Patescibacteria group bacterium]
SALYAPGPWFESKRADMKKKISPREWSDKRILTEFKALRVGYGLKRTLRYWSKRDFSVHSESVAEHLFALHFLSSYFLLFEDPKHKLDVARVHKIITFHDFGEILNGDVPYHKKTKKHEKQEHKDAKKVFSSLPLSIKKIAYQSWKEYLDRKSREAQFVYALDKIEPLFELFDPVNELSMKRLKFSYKSHFGKKFLATENFPVMRRFVEAVSKDMLRRKVFWKN